MEVQGGYRSLADYHSPTLNAGLWTMPIPSRFVRGGWATCSID